ncbi:hypothetical protein U91I_00544 [alpha proteobacterium U9-1i]|nr:hypothetical protein U91I_00544 [alpha proteobacterium U9-1i]
MSIRIAVLFLCVVLSACNAEVAPVESSARSSAVVPATDEPPTVDGVYTFPGCEGEGGCPFQNWRTIEPTTLLAEQSPTASALATLTPGEWVSVEAVETRLLPVRGVVREDAQNLRAGEVVYQLEYEGEGYSTYWVRGERASLGDSVQVEWEQQVVSPAVQATLGLWARVRRENGQVGWAHEARFECMGQLAGDEDCRG